MNNNHYRAIIRAFLIAGCATFICLAQEPAKVTIFREADEGQGFFAAGLASLHNPDWVDSRYRFEINLDGTYVAGMHPGRFVTFDVPAGRHEIRMKRSERIVFNLKPGERIYVRPSLRSKRTAMRALETVEVIPSCRDIASYVADQTLAPIQPRDIHFGEIAPETNFPTCSTVEIADQPTQGASK